MKELAEKPAVEEAPKTASELRREKAAARRAEAEAKRAEAAKNGETSSSADETASKKDEGGMPFSTLIVILAGVLALVTVLAKVFMKPSEDGGE